MNINEGHRSRVKKRFDDAGLEGFADHEILEFLLFYSITRIDTKPLAKRLLKEFGSIEAVLSASPEKLLRVPGMGSSSSRLFSLVKELSKFCAKRKAFAERPVISSASALMEYLGVAMANLPEEQFRVVFLDNSNRVIREEVMSSGVEDQTAVYPKKVMKRALDLHSTGIIVVNKNTL